MTALASDPHVGLVVEGAGDKAALPIVLRRHLEALGDYRDVLGKPVPLHGRSKAIVPGGIEGYVATAARPGCVGVLVVLDGDDDCVAELGPDLLGRARQVTSVPVYIALAERDFEDWVYAAAESLEIGLGEFDPGVRGKKAIPRALYPEAYTKPVYQPKLASRMDLVVASRRSASFARMLRCFQELRCLLPPPA
jgi:hypothetical protein